VRLITWNVARRLSALDRQAEAVGTRRPDVLCLQEITANSLPRWIAAAADLGLTHHRQSLRDGEQAPVARRTGVLVAAREPLGEPAVAPRTPWPQSVVAATLAGAQILAAHVPNAANGEIKPLTLLAIAGWAQESGSLPVVICGDLNTPRKEHPDGTVWTFARDSRGRLRPERGEEWDAAERAVLLDLDDPVDAFRALNGYAERELSWTWRRYPRSGYRLDHVVASPALVPARATYHHEWRTTGLSDHSALEVEFAAWA
jgi:exonuclease III